jgi:isopentenyl phosphate kinase
MLQRQEKPQREPKPRGQPNLAVLKLGGSAITHKDKLKTPNLAAMRRLGREVAEAQVKHLILVHGGGSYGHPLAKLHAIKEGYRVPAQVAGFAETHQAMMELNKLVVDTLVSCGVAAFSVSPSSFIITKGGRIRTLDAAVLTHLLELGCVPVLFGDAVVDENIGFTILSGDQLVAAVATRFKASKVVIGVDVAGVHTLDPKSDSTATPIPRIKLQGLKAILNSVEGAKTTDVTGGMVSKIRELMPAINAGIPAVIVNAAEEGNVYKALKGEDVVGTKIEKG